MSRTTRRAPQLVAAPAETEPVHAMEFHLRRLRLLLERRIAHLRRQWSGVPLAEYRPLVVTDQEATQLLQTPAGNGAANGAPTDADVAQIEDRIARVERVIAFASKGAAAAETRLDQAARAFGLGRFERDVLLLALAPWIDAGFARLYAYCHDDAAKRHATPRLAIDLAPPPGGLAEGLALLSPNAPLRRLRLIRFVDGASAVALLDRPIVLDEAMAGFLAGAPARADATGALRALAAAPLTPDLEALVPALAGFLSSTAGGMLNLVGPAESGRRALAHAAAARLGRPVLQVDLAALESDAAARDDTIAILAREQRLHGHLLFADVDDTDATAAREGRSAARALLDALPGPVVVASRRRWPTTAPSLVQPMPRSEPGARKVLWTQTLAALGAPATDGLDEVCQEFDLGPHQVLEATRNALSAASSRDRRSGVGRKELWRACRAMVGGRMGELAQRIDPSYDWNDIVLPADVLRQLREVADQVAHRGRVYQGWGFAAKRSRGLGISALFAGPSGTGKTMAAEVLARHLDLDLYRIDLASIVNKYVGETEKNLRRVFDAADAGGAILFFDEADALFGKRTEVKDAHDRYANIEIDYLLQRMEDFRGLAILATNRRTDLDRAFLRRLRAIVEFPFPDIDLRRGIWQKAFPAEARRDRIDFDALARLEIAGGSIRNVALAAAFLAAGEDKPIAMRHVVHAARREYAKIERQAHDAEFAPLLKAVAK